MTVTHSAMAHSPGLHEVEMSYEGAQSNSDEESLIGICGLDVGKANEQRGLGGAWALGAVTMRELIHWPIIKWLLPTT